MCGVKRDNYIQVIFHCSHYSTNVCFIIILSVVVNEDVNEYIWIWIVFVALLRGRFWGGKNQENTCVRVIVRAKPGTYY